MSIYWLDTLAKDIGSLKKLEELNLFNKKMFSIFKDRELQKLSKIKNAKIETLYWHLKLLNSKIPFFIVVEVV